MDDFTYRYNTEEVKINQLVHIDENTRLSDNFDANIENMGTYTEGNYSSWNYEYDEIGNLLKDKANDIPYDGIKWNVYGKVKSITRSEGSTYSNLEFYYDATGNSIAKLEKPVSGKANEMTYYVCDASGNIMATYETQNNATKLQEMPIYASGRIGLANNQGGHTYELTDHLGNVRATFKEGENGAEVLSAKDYYPFGMSMPGRNANSGDYRYGFGGQEKDDEISGNGNSYTAQFWQYDPRLGRRWNIDPVTRASESSYAAFRNNPIYYIDPKGDNPPSYLRLIFYGGAKSSSHNSAFSFASKNIKKDYTDVVAERIEITSARQIINKINSQKENTIQSIDFVAHGGNDALYIKDDPNAGSWTENNQSLYSSESERDSHLSTWRFGDGNSGYVGEIDYNKFTDGAKIEFHGCKACSNAGDVGSEDENIAAEMSRGLFSAGKKNAVVIGHSTKANPNINGEGKTKLKDQDYRFNQRVVYHNGSVLFKTSQKGRIRGGQIRKALKKKNDGG